jgi:hypothetical protein
MRGLCLESLSTLNQADQNASYPGPGDGHEGVIFSNETNLGSTQEYETNDAIDLFPYTGPSCFSRLYQLYPASDFNSTFFQRQTWFGGFIINCGLSPHFVIAERLRT